METVPRGTKIIVHLKDSCENFSKNKVIEGNFSSPGRPFWLGYPDLNTDQTGPPNFFVPESKEDEN